MELSKEEQSIRLEGIQTALTKLGVAVVDKEGQYRPIYDILEELSMLWELEETSNEVR